MVGPAPFATLLLTFAFVWGAVWGSFLNVVIYRLPLEMSVVRPGSRCGSCEAPIRFYDNVPILSYLLLRGRCRRCKASFSPRYMLVEAACGVISLFIARSVFDFTDPDRFLHGLMWWLAWQILAYALVAIAFIDLEHTIVPEVLTYPTAALGLIVAFTLPNGLEWEAVWGLLGGAGFLGAVAGVGWLVYRREAMGLGDVHILAMLGAWLGWRALPFIILASAVQALLAVLLSSVYERVTGKSDALTMTTQELDARFEEEGRFPDAEEHTVIPYGPFLALAGLEAMLFGTDAFWWLVDRLFQAMTGGAP